MLESEDNGFQAKTLRGLPLGHVNPRHDANLSDWQPQRSAYSACSTQHLHITICFCCVATCRIVVPDQGGRTQ